MEVRKAFVSNITRWFLFLVVMVFYPAMNAGLLMASQQIAKLVSGNWVNQLGSNLQNYYQKNAIFKHFFIDNYFCISDYIIEERVKFYDLFNR